MEEGQKWKIVSEYEFVKNVYTLSEFVEIDTEIPYPYGQPLTEYGKVFEMLQEMIAKLVERLNAEAENKM